MLTLEYPRMITLHIGKVAEAQGLNIKTLADRAGIAYNTAHGLYTGRATRIDLETLDRICAALNVSPGELLVRSPNDSAGHDAP